MKIPTPQEIGLPPKFDKWRDTQIEGIDVIITSNKRTKALSIPTGGGKSPLYIGAAIMSKKPTCIVTNSRGLQDQLMLDFSSVGLVDLRGKRNYECDMREDYTCEEGQAARCPYWGSVACPRSLAEMKAATSSLVVTNYALWTSARKYGQGMQHFQQVVFDEAHEMPRALADAMQVVLNHKEIEETLGVDFLQGSESEDFANWKPWAAKARAVAEQAMIKALSRISGSSTPKSTWVKNYTHMRNLTKRLATLATASAKDWVVDQLETGYQFDPIRPGKYAEGALLMRIPSIIAVSATLRPKTLFMCNMSKDTFDFREFDSEFDPKRCPTYYVPTMRVDKRNTDLSLLWMRLDQIAAKRRDRKGIVHTVSYARQEEIMATSRFADSMIINNRGEAPSSVIEQFKAAKPGTNLISPSVGTGYDFPGSDCEWQLMCKIPFEPPSKIVKAREAADSEYRSYQAMQQLIQAFGRGMRSKTDQCENFICDDHVQWFIPKYKHLAPKSFHALFQQVQVLPQPPKALVASANLFRRTQE